MPPFGFLACGGMRRPVIVCRGPCRGAPSLEPDSVFDDAFGLEPVLQFVQIDGFLFE